MQTLDFFLQIIAWIALAIFVIVSLYGLYKLRKLFLFIKDYFTPKQVKKMADDVLDRLGVDKPHSNVMDVTFEITTQDGNVHVFEGIICPQKMFDTEQQMISYFEYCIVDAQSTKVSINELD